MNDVITITISRRAVRLFLLVLAVLLILGIALPLVLMNLGGGAAETVHAKRVHPPAAPRPEQRQQQGVAVAPRATEIAADA